MRYTRLRHIDPALLVEEAAKHRMGLIDTIQELAVALKKGGFYFPPVISPQGDGKPKIIVGEDEVYAAAIAEMPRIVCLVLEARAADVALLRHSPLERTSTDDKLRMAKRVTAMLVPPSGAMGRPKLPKTLVYETVAAASGITLGAIRQREVRAKRKQLTRGQLDAEPIRNLGVRLSEAFTRQTTRAREIIERAYGHARDAAAALRQVEREHLPYPGDRLERLTEDADELAAAIKASRPDSVCPRCKAVEGYPGICSACAALGYLLENQVMSVAPELMDPRKPMVELPDGTRRTVQEMLDTSASPVVEDCDPFA